MMSYITTAEADATVAAIIPSTDPERTTWEGLETADKVIFVDRAMLKIETLRFSGVAAVSFQETAFPRRGQTEVPDEVKQAVALEAAAIATYGEEAAQRERIQAQGITSFKAGNLSESYERRARVTLLSSTASYLLTPFLAGVVPCV